MRNEFWDLFLLEKFFTPLEGEKTSRHQVRTCRSTNPTFFYFVHRGPLYDWFYFNLISQVFYSTSKVFYPIDNFCKIVFNCRSNDNPSRLNIPKPFDWILVDRYWNLIFHDISKTKYVRECQERSNQLVRKSEFVKFLRKKRPAQF